MNADSSARRKTARLSSYALNGALMILATAIGVTMVDQTLSALGFPREYQERVTHPANIDKIRKNIEFTYEFKTNDHGLRYKSIPPDKAPGSRRVLVVGDSFVEGFGVNAEHTFAARLEQLFSDARQSVLFINAGLSGQGPDKYQAVIGEIAEPLMADGILICLYANDLWDTTLPREQRRSKRRRDFAVLHSVWPRITIQIEKLLRDLRRAWDWHFGVDNRFVEKVTARAKQLGIPEERIEEWQRKLPGELLAAANRNEIGGPVLSFGLLNPRFWSDSIDLDTQEAREKWIVMRETLSHTVSQVRAMNKDIGIVYIPSVFQYDPASHEPDRPWPSLGSVIRSSWLNEETAIQRELRELTLAENVPFLDLTPSLRKHVHQAHSPLNWRYDEHLTPEGHRVVSSEIGKWLGEQRVFSFLSMNAASNPELSSDP